MRAIARLFVGSVHTERRKNGPLCPRPNWWPSHEAQPFERQNTANRDKRYSWYETDLASVGSKIRLRA